MYTVVSLHTAIPLSSNMCSCAVSARIRQEAHGPQSSPNPHFQTAITCSLDWHDDSCMVDLKLQNRTEQNFIHVGKHVGSLTGDIRYIKNIQKKKKKKDIEFLSLHKHFQPIGQHLQMHKPLREVRICR